MTTNVVTDEQLGAYARREHELFSRIRKGTLPYESVMDGLQRLIEGNFGTGVVVSEPFSVTVDRSLTFVQMIEAGGYDNREYAVELISEERFPVDRTGALKVEKELFLIPLSHDGMTTTEWKAELEANGWELEQAPELLALGAKYPDLQREFYIVAFGSSLCGPFGHLLSPELWTEGGYRKADAIWYNPDIRWGRHDRALVSRKSV